MKDVIVRSTQGHSYESGDNPSQRSEHRLRCSMSRKWECLDNAVAESYLGTLNNELIYHEDYKTRVQAKQSIFEYIETFYNRKPRHATLNYMTPVEYEAKYTCNQIIRFIGGTSGYRCRRNRKIATAAKA